MNRLGWQRAYSALAGNAEERLKEDWDRLLDREGDKTGKGNRMRKGQDRERNKTEG